MGLPKISKYPFWNIGHLRIKKFSGLKVAWSISERTMAVVENLPYCNLQILKKTDPSFFYPILLYRFYFLSFKKILEFCIYDIENQDGWYMGAHLGCLLLQEGNRVIFPPPPGDKVPPLPFECILCALLVTYNAPLVLPVGEALDASFHLGP